MKSRRFFRTLFTFIAAIVVANAVVGVSFAQDESDPAATLTRNLDTLWMLIAAFLVFWMQIGFALVEAGFTRTKNITNILMKNLLDFVIGSLTFLAIGFALMYGGDGAFIGGEQWFFLDGVPEIFPGLTVSFYAFAFFQLVFAATAATIVSGALAERAQFRGYLVYSAVISVLIYPVVGHWIWGGGWLAQRGTAFHDFAGSTVVHSTGGWLALVGAIFLGPRIGRFGKKAVPMPGHNITLAMLGTFILWFGWFGFNPGSQLNTDAPSISLVTLNTNLAACAGAFAAAAIGWYLVGKPQLSWSLNGALAGLVAITAPCAVVTPTEAIIIGGIGGAVMYAVVVALERMKIDDPVGAVGVHLGGGIWGTLAVGIFADSGSITGLLHGGGMAQLITQVLGIITVGAFVVGSGAVLFGALKATNWLRASAEAERIGLDLHEHGMLAYPDALGGLEAIERQGATREPVFGAAPGD